MKRVTVTGEVGGDPVVEAMRAEKQATRDTIIQTRRDWLRQMGIEERKIKLRRLDGRGLSDEAWQVLVNDQLRDKRTRNRVGVKRDKYRKAGQS